MGRIGRQVLGLALPPLTAAGAVAATGSGQFQVTAAVQNGCALSGAMFNFGQYVSGQAADLDAVGTLSYANCSGEVTLELDGGQSGDVGDRRLRSGGNSIGYQIYRDPARTAVWGLGTEALVVNFATAQSGRIEVFGRIAGGRTVEPGTYTDTVGVTLTF